MQKINNKNGITLIALIVTIIVLSIILGITLNYGLSEIHNASNKKTESELGIVQEAIMQRYALVKSENKLGITAPAITSDAKKDASTETNRPDSFVGTRIANSSTISSTYGFTDATPIVNYSSGESNLPFEKYYYYLDENDLKDLGIEEGKSNKDSTDSTGTTKKENSYIINYFTGEIFDTTHVKYYKTDTQDKEQVFTQPTQIEMDQKNYDFNDN